MGNITSDYKCPKCGWKDLWFDGTYYRIKDGYQIFDLSEWDLEETGKPLPEEYYPKISEPKETVSSDGVKYLIWNETYKCPDCGEIFTIENSNY